MSRVCFAPVFFRKVLAVEARGGAPARVQLSAPSRVAKGEAFAVRVAVLDGPGYPSVECGERVVVRGAFASEREMVVAFDRGQPAVARIEGVAATAAGVFRFEAEMGGRTWWSDPVEVVDGAPQRLWWGDPHVHTVLSRCLADRCRSLNFCYAAARWVTGLDWVAAADHVSNNRCDFATWKEQRAVCEAHDDPPEFVTLHAYEASLKGGGGGDNNVYLLRPLESFVDDYESGTVRTLCEKLGGVAAPGGFFVVPHHTTRTGKHGEIGDDIYPGPERMPVAEIHSKWGTSEFRGNPNPLQTIHEGPSYVVDLLRRGLRLGFIAGTDTHATMPSGGGLEAGHIDRLPGLTAVMAPALSREGVFHAMRTRRCYATSLERILLDVSVAGAGMGEMVDWPEPRKPRALRVSAAGRSDIVSIEIVRNGEVVHRLAPGGWQGVCVFEDGEDLEGLWLESAHLGRFVFYYARVTCASGAQAWSSPVWLRQGRGG